LFLIDFNVCMTIYMYNVYMCVTAVLCQVKPNFAELGGRLGAQMKAVAKALTELSTTDIRQQVEQIQIIHE
jgi:hypothetical protein